MAGPDAPLGLDAFDADDDFTRATFADLDLDGRSPAGAQPPAAVATMPTMLAR